MNQLLELNVFILVLRLYNVGLLIIIIQILIYIVVVNLCLLIYFL